MKIVVLIRERLGRLQDVNEINRVCRRQTACLSPYALRPVVLTPATFRGGKLSHRASVRERSSFGRDRAPRPSVARPAHAATREAGTWEIGPFRAPNRSSSPTATATSLRSGSATGGANSGAIPQLEPLDLAGGGLRQRGPESHRARVLVWRDDLVHRRQGRLPESAKAVCQVWREVMGRNYPAMAFVQVAASWRKRPALVEIQAQAVVAGLIARAARAGPVSPARAPLPLTATGPASPRRAGP